MKATTLYSCMVAALFGASCLPAIAADLAEGTVISAANLDQVKNATFEGHTIGSMLTEKMEWRIRNSGWKLTLAHSKKVPLDQNWVKASKANEGKTKINDASCKVDGWKAGAPFPTIDMKDPEAGKKIAWNLGIGSLLGDVSSVPNFTQVLIDGKSGIHAELVAEFTRMNMKGRLTGGASTLGSDDESARQLLFFKAPSEVKGIGTFTVMYDAAKVPDVWAYVPAVRRTRRLSGGAWMDPVGSSDQLQDDLDGFNARPCWYPGYKLLSKRWVLAAANSKLDVWNQKASSPAQKYPTLDHSAPYWNLNDSYEPREVYVLEVATPAQHPYSKKVLYVETEYPRVHYVEAYNRKGEFWKFMDIHSYVNTKAGDIRTVSADVIDFQRNHATISLIDVATWRTNFDAKPSDVSLTRLESAGR
ncbi:DUF1329 domain-containing protein [Massilia agilis]|uniref:DUF1329 domain-containing protein n=1 Tax=Massilia agilis TaxID=1811226 RepID=A0ABT2DD89_9BURK|nr:DUF1329 domain-containing protein [Massilia agilis]MCS0808398.1 DUF1329 domain-containing protein [Massilia agilis]